MSLISVIIPCHNYGRLLSETLESLVQQTHSDWECIVVDDGSVDNTRQVVQEFAGRDGRFRYIHQSNGGVSRARNNGLRHALGEYIQFLDADDLLAVRKLEIHLGYLFANPSVGLVYGPVQYFDDGDFGALRQSLDMSLLPWMPNASGQGADMVFQLVKSNIMVIQSPLVKKSSLEKTGYFNEALRYNEDWYLWLKCALVGMTMVYDGSPEGMSYVRVHMASASQDRSKMLAGEKHMRLLLKADLSASVYHEFAGYNDARIIELNERLGNIYFERNLLDKGVRAFAQNAWISGEYVKNLRNILYQFKKKLRSSR